MRNWHPLLADTVRQMSRDGVKKAVGLIMSVYQSRSSRDQYKTDVANAIAKAGVDLSVEYAGPLFDHAGFIEAASNQVKRCLEQLQTVAIPTVNLYQNTVRLPMVIAASSFPELHSWHTAAAESFHMEYREPPSEILLKTCTLVI